MKLQVLQPEFQGLPAGQPQLFFVQVNAVGFPWIDGCGQPGGYRARAAAQVQEGHPRPEERQQVAGVSGGASPLEHFHEDVGVTHGVGFLVWRGFRLDVRGRFDEDVWDFRRRAGFCGIVHSSSSLVLGMGGRRPSGWRRHGSLKLAARMPRGVHRVLRVVVGHSGRERYANWRVWPGAGHGGSRGWEVGRRPAQGLFRAVFVRELEERDVLLVRQVQCPLGSGLADDGGEGGDA